MYFRALQGHSGRNLIDPLLQDNVVIQSNFFQYIYHVGCALNFHSIVSSGLIPGGQSLSKRQTVFFLPVDPMDTNLVPLERNLYGHPLAGLLWERQFEKILLKHGWEKIPNWECLFVHREKGLFLSVYVDDIKLAGKNSNLDPMWKLLNKEVDLGEPTSFLDHIYLGLHSKTM